MSQVHKEALAAVENALPNRVGLDIEIFGMEGIPEDVIQSHNQRVLTQFHQAEAERRATTGNLGPGGSAASGSATKKPKFETPSELKKRLAEHKAKVAAEQAAGGGSSGDATPLGAGHSPTLGQSPGAYVSDSLHMTIRYSVYEPNQAGSPSYPPHQQPYNGTQSNAPISYPPPYGQPGAPYHQPTGAFPPPHNDFASPTFQQYPPAGQPFQPNPQFSPPGMQSMPPQYHNGPPVGPPRGYGTNSPSVPFHPNQHQSPRTQTPPQNGAFPPRSGSLPSAPGLPQRPVVGAPQVNAFQMQQIHQGQIPGSLNQSPMNSYPGQDKGQHDQGYQGHAPQNHFEVPYQTPTDAPSANATSLDDLISSAGKEADDAQKATSKVEEKPREEKTGKKEKEKNKATKLIYSDNDISPEEKMAKLDRYAFVPDKRDETVLGEAVHATVAGVVDS
jgi:hypothetical protein